MEKKIELHVLSMTNSHAQIGAYAMLLGEVKGSRKLPIIIGPAEAQATALGLKGTKTSRPLTHELLHTCVTALSATLYRVLIYKAKEGVFYSYIYLRKNENQEIIRIDARTSDAVALAVRTDAPIYIYESILDQEGLNIEEEKQEETIELKSGEGHDPEPFRRIQSLSDLEDQLTQAIQLEDYERAARLRDEIQRLK